MAEIERAVARDIPRVSIMPGIVAEIIAAVSWRTVALSLVGAAAWGGIVYALTIQLAKAGIDQGRW